MLSSLRKRAYQSLHDFVGKRRYAWYLENQKCTGTHTATADEKENEVSIAAGPASFSVRVLQGEWTPPSAYDFAAFGLAALSMTHGWKIDVDIPITEDAAKKLDHMANVYRLWSIGRLSSMRLNFSNLESPNPGDRVSGGILCLSGGIDSTFAAAAAVEEGWVSAFLLIAGADYKNANEKGFAQLRERVSGIASIFGRDLSIVETDIRQSGIEWEMLHGLNLASCLHFFSSTYEAGGFGLDNTIYQDVVRNPWGNNAALPGLFSTEDFAVKGFGETANRVEKTRRIYDYNSDLMDLLSVCWEDETIGGNCGHCRKCIETRLCFHAAGISDEKTFLSHPSLEDAIDKFQVGGNLSKVKGQLVRTSELVDALPKGSLKSRLQDFEAEVRKQYLALDPMR